MSQVNEMYVAVAGRLVAAPESRNTRGGVPFTAFRMASTVRRPNASTGQYEDAGTNFLNVTAFRTLGANVANSLKKGDPVIVYGRLRVNQWVRQDNIPATSVEIDAYSIGHDLSWGTTSFEKVARAQMDQSDRLADPAIQSVNAGFEGYDPDSDPYEVDGDLDETGAAARASTGQEQDDRQLSSV